MKKLLYLLFFGLSSLYAQTEYTLTIQPDDKDGKDAILHGLISKVDMNYGNNPQIIIADWTFQSTPGTVRSVLEFDLEQLPDDIVLVSAELSLYAWALPTSSGMHSSLSGSNESWIRRVTSPWNEEEVTWNLHPDFTLENQTVLPESNFEDEDYLDMDVTTLVQDMLDEPENSFGFLFQLQQESYYRRLNFCSSDHEDPSRRPKLVLTYISAEDAVDGLSIEEDQTPLFQLYPNPAQDVLYLQLNKEEITQSSIRITNTLGQVLKEEILYDFTHRIDVSDLSPGMYFVSINNDGQKATKQIIIQ